MRRFWLIVSIFTFVACGPKPTPSSLAEDRQEQSRFLEKASKLLRYGKIPTETEMARWLSLDIPEVLNEMTSDPVFPTSVLDFNLYFLGARPQSIRMYNDRWQAMAFHDRVYENPSAIHAAKEVAHDGNFFSLLEFDQPLYLAPIARAEDEPRGEEDIRAVFDKGYALFAPDSLDSVDEACKKLRTLELDNVAKQALDEGGFQESVSDGQRNAYRRIIRRQCYEDLNDPNQSKEAILARLKAFYQRIEAIYAYEATQNRDSYPQKFVSDIRDAALVVPDFGVASSMFTREGFWRTYVNSSTNYNRKRAQFVLDRFFCDDLTPLDLPNPVPHGQGRHASEPGCQSCHYRLDPMGGHFRFMGSLGRNHEQDTYIGFDDQAYFDGDRMLQYFSVWKNANPDIPLVWNVGYVRDPADHTKNTYASNLTDLALMFKSEPEVRQCIARRLGEFVFGKLQVTDGEWFNEVTRELITANDATSGVAFKSTIKKLVASQTFRQQDPDPEQCYDRLAGSDPAATVPCKISWVIKQNCGSCHEGAAARGGLNLAEWVTGPDGEQTFKYLKIENGTSRQLTRAESFDLIKARLSTTDDTIIMPPRFMHPADRVKLLSFVGGI